MPTKKQALAQLKQFKARYEKDLDALFAKALKHAKQFGITKTGSHEEIGDWEDWEALFLYFVQEPVRQYVKTVEEAALVLGVSPSIQQRLTHLTLDERIPTRDLEEITFAPISEVLVSTARRAMLGDFTLVYRKRMGGYEGDDMHRMVQHPKATKGVTSLKNRLERT